MAEFADDGVMVTHIPEPTISILAGTFDVNVVQVTKLYCGGRSNIWNRDWESWALVVHVSRLYVAGVYHRVRQ